jgi:hypothetical protein
MKTTTRPLPAHMRARAMHRLGKTRCWPAYLIASVAQGTHGDFATLHGSCGDTTTSMDAVLYILAAVVENVVRL